MKKTTTTLLALAIVAGMSGCAYQASPVSQVENPASLS